MKALFLLLFWLVTPLVFLAQEKNLSGLWAGQLSNDSTTIRKDQAFELALTEYKGKVYGYCRSTFIVHDTLYYVLKRVKGTITGTICEVKDDEIVSSNFPGKLDKGVKVVMTFHMNQQDSTWRLDGTWSTVKTKKFYAITGKADLREETNFANSKLLPHLEELRLDKDVPFYAESKKAPVYQHAVAVTSAPVSEKAANNKKADKKESSKTDSKTASSNTTPTSSSSEKTSKSAPVVAKNSAPAAELNNRKMAAPKSYFFEGDSIQLALYDNGEIDGDTVSVLLNGEIIMPKVGLKATAVKHTIAIPANTDSVNIVLYAENLGKYPPNTGLLVVRTGGQVYNVLFSADLQQNAAIVFRRKKE